MAKVKYTPDYSGLRDIGKSKRVQAAAIDGARVIATRANQLDKNGRYSVRATGVPAGRYNEIRAGAAAIDETGSGGAVRSFQTALSELKGKHDE